MFDERMKVRKGEQSFIVRCRTKSSRINPNTLALKSLRDTPEIIKGKKPRTAWKTCVVQSDLRRTKPKGIRCDEAR